MTLLESFDDTRANVDFTLLAADAIYMANVIPQLWGDPPSSLMDAMPHLKQRGKTGTTALRRHNGWMVQACSNCISETVKPQP